MNDELFDLANKINYDALNDKNISRKNFSQEQLEAAGLARKKFSKNMKIFAYAISGIIIVAALILSVIDITSGLFGISFILITIIVIGGMYFIGLFAEKYKYRLLKFTLDNNWEINFTRINNFSSIDALMFKVGNSRMLNYWMQDPNKFLFANYQYTTGSGDNQQTHYFDFAQIQLPRRVPHLIINSRKNNIGVSTFGYDVEKIEVEGDFNKYFKIVTPPEYERDALQILTPDVLQTFIDFGADYDFEMLDNKLIVFASNKTLREKESLQKLLLAIAKLLPEISHQVNTYSDEKVAKLKVRENGAIIASSSQDLISHKGARISQKKWAAVIPIAAVILWIIMRIVSDLLRF